MKRRRDHDPELHHSVIVECNDENEVEGQDYATSSIPPPPSDWGTLSVSTQPQQPYNEDGQEHENARVQENRTHETRGNTRNPVKRSSTIRKSSKHRKRHVLPGPAGAMMLHDDNARFYDRKVKRKHPKNQQCKPSPTSAAVGCTDMEVEVVVGTQREAILPTQTQAETPGTQQTKTSKGYSHHENPHPAWSAMCIALQRYVPTPSMLAHELSRTTTKTKLSYATYLRQALPSRYTLLSELSNQLSIHKTSWLVVRIVKVHCHDHCDWTVDLVDESSSLPQAPHNHPHTSNSSPNNSTTSSWPTSYSSQGPPPNTSSKIFKGWLQASFIKHHPTIASRGPGTVLLLSHASVAVFADERLILIGDDTVLAYWTAEDAMEQGHKKEKALWREQRGMARRLVHGSDETQLEGESSSTRVVGANEADDLSSRKQKKKKKKDQREKSAKNAYVEIVPKSSESSSPKVAHVDVNTTSNLDRKSEEQEEMSKVTRGVPPPVEENKQHSLENNKHSTSEKPEENQKSPHKHNHQKNTKSHRHQQEELTDASSSSSEEEEWQEEKTLKNQNQNKNKNKKADESCTKKKQSPLSISEQTCPKRHTSHRSGGATIVVGQNDLFLGFSQKHALQQQQQQTQKQSHDQEIICGNTNENEEKKQQHNEIDENYREQNYDRGASHTDSSHDEDGRAEKHSTSTSKTHPSFSPPQMTQSSAKSSRYQTKGHPSHGPTPCEQREQEKDTTKSTSKLLLQHHLSISQSERYNSQAPTTAPQRVSPSPASEGRKEPIQSQSQVQQNQNQICTDPLAQFAATGNTIKKNLILEREETVEVHADQQEDVSEEARQNMKVKHITPPTPTPMALFKTSKQVDGCVEINIHPRKDGGCEASEAKHRAISDAGSNCPALSSTSRHTCANEEPQRSVPSLFQQETANQEVHGQMSNSSLSHGQKGGIAAAQTRTQKVPATGPTPSRRRSKRFKKRQRQNFFFTLEKCQDEFQVLEELVNDFSREEHFSDGSSDETDPCPPETRTKHPCLFMALRPRFPAFTWHDMADVAFFSGNDNDWAMEASDEERESYRRRRPVPSIFSFEAETEGMLTEEQLAELVCEEETDK